MIYLQYIDNKSYMEEACCLLEKPRAGVVAEASSVLAGFAAASLDAQIGHNYQAASMPVR